MNTNACSILSHNKNLRLIRDRQRMSWLPIQTEDFKQTLDQKQKRAGSLPKYTLIFKIEQNILTISLYSTLDFLCFREMSAP